MRYTVTRLFVRQASINISVVICIVRQDFRIFKINTTRNLVNAAILSNNCLRLAADRVESVLGAYQQPLTNQRGRSQGKVIEFVHVR